MRGPPSTTGKTADGRDRRRPDRPEIRKAAGAAGPPERREETAQRAPRSGRSGNRKKTERRGKILLVMEKDREFNAGKVYVDVTVRFGKEGTAVPVSFVWEDGETYEIDRVLRVRRAASTVAGGNGLLYICMVSGQKSHLYYEENNRWFMERKIIPA